MQAWASGVRRFTHTCAAVDEHMRSSGWMSASRRLKTCCVVMSMVRCQRLPLEPGNPNPAHACPCTGICRWCRPGLCHRLPCTCRVRHGGRALVSEQCLSKHLDRLDPSRGTDNTCLHTWGWRPLFESKLADSVQMCEEPTHLPQWEVLICRLTHSGLSLVPHCVSAARQ